MTGVICCLMACEVSCSCFAALKFGGFLLCRSFASRAPAFCKALSSLCYQQTLLCENTSYCEQECHSVLQHGATNPEVKQDQLQHCSRRWAGQQTALAPALPGQPWICNLGPLQASPCGNSLGPSPQQHPSQSHSHSTKLTLGHLL